MKEHTVHKPLYQEETLLEYILQTPGTHAITVYTDGACSGNPGPGGWGAVLLMEKGEGKEKSHDMYGGEAQTTNNRMELFGVIAALEALTKDCVIDLYTDSMYVKDGITSWIKNWKKNGWMTAANKPVKNQDLWIRLDKVVNERKISWYWVKGHAGNEYNERAVDLARSAIITQKFRSF